MKNDIPFISTEQRLAESQLHTSMYVDSNYRKQGIGTTILEKLVEKAKMRGYRMIMLNASDMGKPMYRKMGFTNTQNGMILKI